MGPELFMGTLNKIVLPFTHFNIHTRKNLRVLFSAVLLLVLFLSAINAHAAGTPTGTVINNQATANYTIGATAYSTSITTSLRVDDKASFTLTASDSANVTILPNSRAYMTYAVTNTGNGPHDFTLTQAVSGIPTLTPAAGPAFYSDQAGIAALPTDGNAGGLPYISNLASDATRTVYLYITAPATPADGQTADYLITAEAYQVNNLGTVNPPVKSSAKAAADAFVDKNTALMTQYVVLADGQGNGGDALRDGKYAILAKDGSNNTVGFKAQSGSVNVVKTATVSDQFGGSQPMTGSTIHYTLTMTVTGSGTAMNVVIADPIPANTTYTAGTLKLNGAVLTDALDLVDGGDVGGTTPGTVTVKLGNLTSASPKIITFDVKIN
jgi:uncharacterized repeat protein (TIGR01451 family)